MGSKSSDSINFKIVFWYGQESWDLIYLKIVLKFGQAASAGRDISPQILEVPISRHFPADPVHPQPSA